MGAYNVINRTSMQAGQPEDISVPLANFDAIAAVLNGGIDNSNISAGAAIAWTKLVPPSYTVFVPTLTATVTNPTLGAASSVSGSYNRFGKLTVGRGSIQFGSSGVAAGSGNYAVNLPIAAVTAFVCVGFFFVFLSGSYRAGTIQVDGTGLAGFLVLGGGNLVTDAAPWAWAAGGQIHYNFSYEGV